MKLTKRELPWHDWFAWRPVEDWDTGQWYWLETVKRKYRVDGAGSRWYYKPVPSAEDVAAHEERERQKAARYRHGIPDTDMEPIMLGKLRALDAALTLPEAR